MANKKRGSENTEQLNSSKIDNQEQTKKESKSISRQLEDLAKFPEENPYPVMRVNENGVLLYANKACDMLDISACQIGQSLPENYRVIITKALNTNSYQTFEVNGKERLFVLSFVPVKAGGYVNIYGSDITEQKLAERNIVEERDRLLALINSISDEVWFADMEGNFTLVNEAALQQFNLASAVKMNARDMAKSLEVYRPDGSIRPIEEMPPLRALKGEIVKNAESIVRTPKSGDLHYRQVSSSPVRNANGNIIGSVSVVRDITEQKEIEAELRKTEHDLNFAQSIAQMGSWRMDVQNNVLTWSDEAYHIFGRSREFPLIYETFLSCVHPDDREYVDNAWQAALQGEDYDIEHRIIVGNEIRWIHEIAELEFDHEGMLKGGFGTAHDITERKQISQQLEFNSSILEQISDAVVAVDNEERVIYFNKAAQKLYGINIEDAIGRELKEIYKRRWVRPEDESLAYDSLAKYGVWIGDNIHVKRNGGELVVRSSINVLKNNTGAQTGRLSVIRNVTELRRAEEWMVFQSELLNSIEDVVMATDLEGRIIFWGHGAANMLQWQQDEVIGQDAITVLFTKGYKQQGEIIADTLRRGLSWSGELPIKRRDGSSVTVLARTSPVRNASGDVIGAVAVGKDIDELKKAERLKDEFISLVSHELRTPLTVITGSLHSMKYPGISEEDKSELLQNSIESVESLANTLGNMLELSRFQADRLQLHTEPVSISKATQNAIAKLKVLGASQRFLMKIPDYFPAVQADPFRVGSIIYNLLENATKYSPAESDIIISCCTEGDFAIVSITDQGEGISADDQEKLFHIFERLESGTHRARGLGIGLLVCKRLVESQGGWVKVESKLGQGSTFSFSLPIYRTNI